MWMRRLVACFALFQHGCDAPVDPPAPVETVSTSTATAPVTAAPTPSASASTIPAAPAELPLPPSFSAYSAEVEAKCPFDDADGSTAGMVSAQLAVAACQAKLMDVDAKKLSPAQRGALLDGDPKGPHATAPGPTASRWARTIDAACNVEGAQLWVHGGTRTAGTMEHNRAVGCLSGEDHALGFVMRSWTNARPEDVVAYVRAFASRRPAPKPRITIWRRYAALARRTAPHKAEPSCRYQCRWSDAEWVVFERDLDRAEQGSKQVSTALCAEWKELAVAFGGAAACEDEMTSRWLPSSTGMDASERGDENDPKADTSPDLVDLSLPPPADEAYDKATIAMRRAWAADGSEPKGAARYLEEVEEKILAGPRKDLARWTRQARTWRHRFAVADQQAGFMNVSSATESWLSPPYKGIAPTARLLEGYLLRLIVEPNPTALKAHIEARQAWGKAVETNLGKARDAFKKPCKPSGLRDCAGTTPRDFAKVAERIDSLLTEAVVLGGDLCKVAPELQAALGEACPALTSKYLFSFAEHAGDVEMLDGW
jgi:hypothetical protein